MEEWTGETSSRIIPYLSAKKEASKLGKIAPEEKNICDYFSGEIIKESI